MTELTQLTPGPVAVGTKTRDVMVLGSETVVLNLEITAFEPNKLLAAHIDSEGFTEDIRYELSEQNGKTRLQYTGAANYKVWLARLLEPLITPSAQKKLKEDMERLKALVQSQ
jgi:carbon monoxide dehydrogenase subunit G